MNRQEPRAAAKQSQKVAPQNLEAARQSLEAAKQGKLLFDRGRYAEALECFKGYGDSALNRFLPF